MPRVTRVVDARRLTGPTLDLPVAGAVVEVATDDGPDDLATLAQVFEACVGERVRVRAWPGGAALAVPVPIDRLLAVVDRLEAIAIAFVTFRVPTMPNEPLLALQAEARKHGVPFLWDEELTSIGHGARAAVYPTVGIPSISDVDWNVGRIPVALITGTNGKTTTTRMVSRILEKAGHVVGTSSTDAITIGGQVSEHGDWTGPGAARKILRDPRVTAAVLETARGGMLRRGLALDDADVAIVTNVAEDHFGEHGVNDLASMMRTKAVVYGAVRPGGHCILNADDPTAVAWASTQGLDPHRWILLTRALPAPSPALAHAHLVAGGTLYTLDANHITRVTRNAITPIIGIPTIPATFGGTAAHNTANALAAAAVAHALAIPDATVAEALASFGKHPQDNPGRAEHYLVDGVHYLFDFSHNPHGVDALAPLVAQLRAPGARLSIAAGQAGDRTDADLGHLAAALNRWDPNRIYLRDLRGYERGRDEGEVPAVLRRAFEALGIRSDQIVDVLSEVEALDDAYVWARPGDVVVHIVHIERDAVQAWLAAHDAEPA